MTTAIPIVAPIDKPTMLKLFDAFLRAEGMTPSWRKKCLAAADKNFQGNDEAGTLDGIRAVIAVYNGFPLENVRRGFPEGEA